MQVGKKFFEKERKHTEHFGYRRLRIIILRLAKRISWHRAWATKKTFDSDSDF